MTRKGDELIFVSRINGNGKSVLMKDSNYLNHKKFEITKLSFKNKTYIAKSSGTYVVKMKKL